MKRLDTTLTTKYPMVKKPINAIKIGMIFGKYTVSNKNTDGALDINNRPANIAKPKTNAPIITTLAWVVFKIELIGELIGVFVVRLIISFRWFCFITAVICCVDCNMI